jgi:hypothetical protein
VGGGDTRAPKPPPPPPPPPDADSPQKQADWVKTAISHVMVGDVGGHVTSADSGAKTPYCREFLNKWF